MNIKYTRDQSWQDVNPKYHQVLKREQPLPKNLAWPENQTPAAQQISEPSENLLAKPSGSSATLPAPQLPESENQTTVVQEFCETSENLRVKDHGTSDAPAPWLPESGNPTTVAQDFSEALSGQTLGSE